MTPDQESQLIDVLKQNKGVMGWSVTDLKGIVLQFACITFIVSTTPRHLGKCKGD